MLTCSKEYNDVPFAHRSPRDAGHCHFVHGHSWRFVFTFGGEPDARGWVLDFGGLKWLRKFIDTTFDHALIVNADDPELETFRTFPGLFKLRVIADCSCEGIARYLFGVVTQRLRELQSTAHVISVTVHEGHSNSATYVNDR